MATDPAPAAHPSTDARSARRAVLAYNAGRFGLLVLCLGLGWIAGLRGLLLFAAALIVSGILSWFLLARQRVAMGVAVEATLRRTRDRTSARAAAEDAYVDRMLAHQHEQATDDVTPPGR